MWVESRREKKNWFEKGHLKAGRCPWSVKHCRCLVVVAALIATASFAAAFTMLGGLESSDGSKKGTPFLLREPAFQVFVVTNAIAFSYSCCSLLRYIELLLYSNRYDELSPIDGKVETMYLLTTLALVAMTFAFVTGVYVVLTPSPVLAIP
ncbi:hypothetical protein L1987_58220 [Smallanthus sonchifolius]|uniref:Uncharacterized protein n=1 Tax=Smallanthus sonchifolius TaxID=185202 RepID=A0ACB9DEM9_9ASTR|nr:hypothetical protein L1987_58220 [Smallanthus sonchifolius]